MPLKIVPEPYGEVLLVERLQRGYPVSRPERKLWNSLK